jgi:hypothetical protein
VGSRERDFDRPRRPHRFRCPRAAAARASVSVARRPPGSPCEHGSFGTDVRQRHGPGRGPGLARDRSDNELRWRERCCWP